MNINTPSNERISEILANIKNKRIGVLGDMCIDIYWNADMYKSELSRETPHFPLPVVEERISLGAGGNVVANVTSLKPKEVVAFGVIGDDWRGGLFTSICEGLGVNIDNVATQKGRWTNAYCKPYRKGISDVEYEDPRLDFANYTAILEQTQNALIKSLKEAQGLDALCVSDQFVCGCVTPRVRECVQALAAGGLTVIVDSRDRISEYTGVMIKPNEVEGYAAINGEKPIGATREDYLQCALALHGKTNAPVCMTMGELGCIVVDQGEALHVPSKKIPPPIDIVGAGDAFLSGLCCCLAAGADLCEGAHIANICSGITIKKLGTTGTVSTAEILRALTYEKETI